MSWLTNRLLKRIENIEWHRMRQDEQTWVLRALIKSARDWQVAHGLQPTIGDTIVSNAGYCHYCRSNVTFSASDGWLRDHYACSNCGSTPRQRNLMRALDELIPAWTGRVIHESSPSNARFQELCDRYSHSQFIPDRELGSAIEDGGTCQNLENLTFADNSFDVFITQDVLEHVFDPRRAVNEVMRVLKPGGWHIFTTPRHPHLSKTVTRARLKDGRVVHVRKPEYHGNPVGDGKVLVTFEWGRDFEKVLRGWTGFPVITRDEVDQSRGIDGANFEVFAMQKR
ncbi:class I SAM-dependent methyltransferase [Paraburkholderia fungorum]